MRAVVLTIMRDESLVLTFSCAFDISCVCLFFVLQCLRAISATTLGSSVWCNWNMQLASSMSDIGACISKSQELYLSM